jgi:hypothetical protein
MAIVTAMESFEDPATAQETGVANLQTATATTFFINNDTDQDLTVDIDASPLADMSDTYPTTGSPFTVSAGDKLVKTISDMVSYCQLTLTPAGASTGTVTAYMASRRTGGAQ